MNQFKEKGIVYRDVLESARTFVSSFAFRFEDSARYPLESEDFWTDALLLDFVLAGCLGFARVELEKEGSSVERKGGKEGTSLPFPSVGRF